MWAVRSGCTTPLQDTFLGRAAGDAIVRVLSECCGQLSRNGEIRNPAPPPGPTRAPESRGGGWIDTVRRPGNLRPIRAIVGMVLHAPACQPGDGFLTENPDGSGSPGSITDANRAYYVQLSAGRTDYWRKMAAPRFRVATLTRLIREIEPASLVDLGCGGGELIRELGQRFRGLPLCGIDLSETQLELNRSSDPQVDWRCADLTREIPDDLHDRFDVVVASEIIEHLDRPARFLENARRLARPETGRLLLSTQSGPIRETERRVGHFRHYSRPEMEGMLRHAGWLPLRVWNAGFPFHDLSKWYANRDPDGSMERFGGEAYGFSQNAVCFALRIAFRFNSQRRGAQLFALARRARD